MGTSEEMDTRVLVFQNRKLAQQLEAQKDKEDELQKRINDMEQVQALNDDTLSTVNKYWIQVSFVLQEKELMDFLLLWSVMLNSFRRFITEGKDQYTSCSVIYSPFCAPGLVLHAIF